MNGRPDVAPIDRVGCWLGFVAIGLGCVPLLTFFAPSWFLLFITIAWTAPLLAWPAIAIGWRLPDSSDAKRSRVGIAGAIGGSVALAVDLAVCVVMFEYWKAVITG